MEGRAVSRRRKPPEFDGDPRGGPLCITIECDGHEDHAVFRIARVWFEHRLGDGFRPFSLGIDYVHKPSPEEPPESSLERVNSPWFLPGRDLTGSNPHNTFRFSCGVCGWDMPLTDQKVLNLILLVAAVEGKSARLREIPADLPATVTYE